MKTKLTRSTTDRILGGVCAGLANYLGIQAVYVRIFFVLLAIMDWSGLPIYVLLWIMMPADDQPEQENIFEANQFGERTRQMGRELRQAFRKPSPQILTYLGGGLIASGFLFLLENFLRQFDVRWLSWINRGTVGAILLITAGVVLLARASKER